LIIARNALYLKEVLLYYLTGAKMRMVSPHAARIRLEAEPKGTAPEMIWSQKRGRIGLFSSPSITVPPPPAATDATTPRNKKIT
jgi:hypothetical protein